MEPRTIGQLGKHIAEPVHGAAATVGVGPQLVDRPDQARRPVGDDEQRAAQTAPDEAPSEIEPVLHALTLPQADVE